jgi:hypothetical protein
VGLLALYIACMHRGVLDFYTGAKILLQGDVDRHHILPRAQFSEKKWMKPVGEPDAGNPHVRFDDRSTADCIANIAFISGGLSGSIACGAAAECFVIGRSGKHDVVPCRPVVGRSSAQLLPVDHPLDSDFCVIF